MTIQFSCTGCGEGFSVPDVMAGTQASCNKCGATLTVPQPGAAPAKPNPAPAASGGGNPLVDDNYQAPLGAAAGQQSTAGLKYGTLGGAAGLCVLAVLIVFLSGGRPRGRVIAGGPGPRFNSQPGQNQNNANTGGNSDSDSTSSDEGSGSQSGTAKKGNPFRLNPGGSTGGTGSSTSDTSTGAAAKPTETTPDTSTGSSPAKPDSSSGAGGSATGSNSTANDGPAIPDIVRQAATDNGIPRDVIEKAFGSANPAETAETNVQPGSSVGKWEVQPDPPMETIAYKAGRLGVVIPDSSSITYPRAESNFVLVHMSSFGKHAAQMVDLRQGEFVGGTVTDELPFAADVEASADGKYLAVKRRGSSPAFGVWSMETGRLVNDFTFTREQDPESAHFAAADSIVFVNEPFSTEPLKIFVSSLENGASLGEFEIKLTREAPLLKNTFTVSHNGKYAAIVRNDVLSMIDLVDGSIDGETRLPSKPKECVGMAFSPDGGELAGLFNFDSGSHLIIWDMNSGNPLVDAEYDDKLSAFFTASKKPVVCWSPDKSAILLGREYIMDAETGKKIWQLPEASRYPVKFARPFEMLVVNRDTSKRKQTINSVKLPRKEIDKIVAEVRSGGTQIDASLPPLSTADLFSAVRKSHPSSTPSWSMQPDSAEANPRLKMERTTLVSTSSTELQRVRLAQLSGKIVTLRHSSGKAWLEKFDLLRGKRGGQTQIPMIYDLIDANADGGQALIGVKTQRIVSDSVFGASHKGFERLDVIATEGKKHIAGWRPFAAESDKDAQLIHWAQFVDETHVATINSRGKLIVWQIPECKAEYIFEDFGKPLALSSGRRYIATAANDSLRVFDLLSGDCAGELETPPNGAKAIRGAIKQDGKEMAAVIDGGGDYTMARWALDSGTLTANFPLHPTAVRGGLVTSQGTLTDLDYRGDDHVLIDHRYLVNLSRRAVIWRYNLMQGKHIVGGSPDGRHWYCAPYESSSGPWHVNAITMPGDTVNAASEFNKLENQLALYPGMKVAVRVQLGAAAGQLTANEIGQGVSNKLKARGFIVDQKAPQVQLTVSTSRGSTGEQLSVNSGYTPFGGGSSGNSFNQEKVTCTMKLTDRSGNTLWSTSRNVTMRSVGIVNGENVQGQLQAEMLRSVEGLLRDGNIVDATMPRFIFKDLAQAMSGESDMTLAGEGQRVDPVARKKAAEEAAKRARQNRPATGNPGVSPPGGGFGPGGFPGRPGFPGGRPGLPGRGFPSFPGRGGSRF